MSYRLKQCILIILFYISSFSSFADPTEAEQEGSYLMNNDRLDAIIRRLDNNPEGKKGYWQFKISDLEVMVITDEKANRMRIVIPIIESKELSQEHLYRLMQANFDSALDSRYAIAQEILWSAYIHPLESLRDDEFLTGLGETVNLVTTFGDSFSSGLLTFGGGDSKEIKEKQLIEELLDKGISI